MVITASDSCTASGVNTFGVLFAMSIPTSAIASTATGLIESFGAEPAESTSTRPCPSSRIKPAAICDRPALCTHTKRTVGLLIYFSILFCGFNNAVNTRPSVAPIICAAINGSTDEGAMPAKVSESVLATVTAGLAKLVEEVKK